MDFRRFLRYVVPGLLFATEALVVFALLRPDLIVTHIQRPDAAATLGAAFSALLASGGIGFLLSTLHHTFHWWPFWPKPTVVDHSPQLKALASNDIISFRSATNGSELETRHLSREEAWILVTSIWHSRRESSLIIKGADPAAASLADMVHATGTARVSAVAAPLTALVVAALVSEPSQSPRPLVRFGLAMALSVALAVVAWNNHRRTGRFAQGVIDQVLAHALAAERLDNEDSSQPVELFGLSTMPVKDSSDTSLAAPLEIISRSAVSPVNRRNDG